MNTVLVIPADSTLPRDPNYYEPYLGQSITLTRDEVRARLDQLADYFMAHGVADRAMATAKAVGQLGAIVKRQALVMGFSGYPRRMIPPAVAQLAKAF